MGRFFVGTSGWNYGHWKGKFYPEELPKSRWFEHYSRSFSTVEANYPFYRWPTEKTIRNWYATSPRDFRYTLKAPRMITNLKRLKGVKRLVSDFYRLTSLLREKMGCHLFQLPPSFRMDERNVERLEGFLRVLDSRKENAIEFRHKSWWNKDIYGLLEKHKVTFCNVSGLGMPPDVVAAGDTAYFRFHGRKYNTCYSGKELKGYARAMRKLKCRRAYAYFNNDANAFAVKNAKQLRRELKNA